MEDGGFLGENYLDTCVVHRELESSSALCCALLELQVCR